MIKTDEHWRKELADFLKSRRQRLSPLTIEANVINNGAARRRTPGLRREEVASLAGVGLTWYTWLEQGRPIRVSTQVLESLSQTLRLDAKEKEHLFFLAHQQLPVSTPPPVETLSPAVQMVLDGLSPQPACITGRRMDLIAWNASFSRVFGDFDNRSALERNLLWFTFTDPTHRVCLVNWECNARRMLAEFRGRYGQSIGDPKFESLVEQLKATSPEFAEWWSLHAVQNRLEGHKEYNHPLVGRLVFDYVTFSLTDNPDLKLKISTPLTEYDTPAKIQKLLEQPSYWEQARSNL